MVLGYIFTPPNLISLDARSAAASVIHFMIKECIAMMLFIFNKSLMQFNL